MNKILTHISQFSEDQLWKQREQCFDKVLQRGYVIRLFWNRLDHRKDRIRQERLKLTRVDSETVLIQGWDRFGNQAFGFNGGKKVAIKDVIKYYPHDLIFRIIKLAIKNNQRENIPVYV